MARMLLRGQKKRSRRRSGGLYYRGSYCGWPEFRRMTLEDRDVASVDIRYQLLGDDCLKYHGQLDRRPDRCWHGFKNIY